MFYEDEGVTVCRVRATRESPTRTRTGPPGIFTPPSLFEELELAHEFTTVQKKKVIYRNKRNFEIKV